MAKPQQPVIFSSDDYIIPQWAALPKYQFFFQIIKEGSIIGKIPIKKKQFSLIGRLEDLCDIFIDNPSVSRKHAILQFQSQDSLPLLYDLGSAQGTFVNKQKLPPKAYKKIQLYANLKFGASSRYYILRCPQLEQKLNEQEEEKQNEFMKTLTQQTKTLTKQQAKNKYLQLLQNDPYFGGQLKSRKFEGHQKTQNEPTNQYEGITWGIGDQTQVYAYKNQRQFPIEPDVIRRLPGLDQKMLQSLAQYEQKYRVYDEIQAELNELTNKQRRQFGLQQKLQGKKQKLQKRFVESLQALQKCEDWIRVNIFGDESNVQANKNRNKFKQVDTYSDDQFYDRTLQNKHQAVKNDQNEKQGKNKGNKIEQCTVQDLWMLKNSFLSELGRKKQLLSLQKQNKLINRNKQSVQSNNQEKINKQQQQIQQQQQDELQLYMRQNNENLQQQNKNMYARQIQIVEQNLLLIKGKLMRFLTQRQISKLQQQVLNPQRIRQKQVKKQKKQQQQKDRLCKTLQRLQAQDRLRIQKQQRKQRIQRQCVDEYSQKIFELYKQDYQQQQQDDNKGRQYTLRPQDYQQQQDNQNNNRYKRPNKKIHYNQNQQYNNHNNQNQQNNQQNQQQEEIVDLTKNFS